MKLRAYLHVLAVGGALLGAGLGSGSALAQQNQAPMSPRMQALVREDIEVTNATKMFDDIITSAVPAPMDQPRQRHTPIGQHVLAAAPRMAQEILPLASRWGQEAAQRAMQRAIGKARERGIQL